MSKIDVTHSGALSCSLWAFSVRFFARIEFLTYIWDTDPSETSADTRSVPGGPPRAPRNRTELD